VTARRLLLAGALLTALGLALAMTVPAVGAPGHEQAGARQLTGGIAVLLGWATLAWGIHRFGRGGA
jgi:hypothetical protein